MRRQHRVHKTYLKVFGMLILQFTLFTQTCHTRHNNLTRIKCVQPCIEQYYQLYH